MEYGQKKDEKQNEMIELKEKYELELNEMKEHENTLKLRLETIEKERQENMIRNKEAIQN